MKKLTMVIGLAALLLLAVSARAADPGRFDSPDLVLVCSNVTVDVSTNASVLMFSTNALRFGIFLNSASGNSAWLQPSTNSALGSNTGVLITFTNESLFLPASKTGKGQLRLRGNLTNTIPVQGVEATLPR